MDVFTEKKDKRLALRITASHKDLIERAATLRGQHITDFVTGALIEASQDVIERSNALVLSDRDRDLFISVLGSNEEPNEALTQAAKAYREQFDKGTLESE